MLQLLFVFHQRHFYSLNVFCSADEHTSNKTALCGTVQPQPIVTDIHTFAWKANTHAHTPQHWQVSDAGNSTQKLSSFTCTLAHCLKTHTAIKRFNGDISTGDCCRSYNSWCHPGNGAKVKHCFLSTHTVFLTPSQREMSLATQLATVVIISGCSVAPYWNGIVYTFIIICQGTFLFVLTLHCLENNSKNCKM